MSRIQSIAMASALVAVVLLVAMSADLLLVPAMVQVGLIRFPNKAA